MKTLVLGVTLVASLPAFSQTMPYLAPSNDASGPNLLCCTPVNAIDPHVHSSTVFGGLGNGDFPNLVGASFAGINGGPADTYVAGSASYATISGGYDNVDNALAGAILSTHARLYTAATHGLIIGGGLHWISNGDSNSIVGGVQHHISSLNGDNIIAGGAQNVITGQGSASAIIGGAQQTISGGAYSAIVAGYSNSISAPAAAQTIIGGVSNTISGAATFAAIAGGHNNVVSSNFGSIVGGYDNSVSGYAGAIVGGDTSQVTAPYAVAFGSGRVASWPGGVFYGARNQTTPGDRNNLIVAQSGQTSNATPQGLSGYGTGDYPSIPSNTAGIARVMIVGRQQHSNNVVAYTGVVVFHSGNGGIVVADSQSWSKQVDQIGVAAQPALQSGANDLFALLVTGKAATIVDWNADVQVATVSGP
jgi:hypothetical protein